MPTKTLLIVWSEPLIFAWQRSCSGTTHCVTLSWEDPSRIPMGGLHLLELVYVSSGEAWACECRTLCKSGWLDPRVLEINWLSDNWLNCEVVFIFAIGTFYSWRARMLLVLRERTCCWLVCGRDSIRELNVTTVGWACVYLMLCCLNTVSHDSWKWSSSFGLLQESMRTGGYHILLSAL